MKENTPPESYNLSFRLLSVESVPRINIGDYVQALAAAQFLPHIDGFVERDELSHYTEEPCNVIMNGWYMHRPENWPPPTDKIRPLFVAFHVNSLVKEQMCSKKSIAYLKQYEPIGCRDMYTRDMLRECGVDAYFSGCLTLTLGKTYKSDVKDGKVYIVDVNFPIGNRLHKLGLVIYSLLHLSSILKIFKKKECKFAIWKWCQTVLTYKNLKKIVEKDVLLNAEYITQEDERYNVLGDNYARLEAAKNLVRDYARASLVITSRIHCALPCLAVGTPVYYAYNDNSPKWSSSRLDGLIQLFNVIHWTGKNWKHEVFNSSNKISMQNILSNKTDYLKYASSLIEKCNAFIKGANK